MQGPERNERRLFPQRRKVHHVGPRHISRLIGGSCASGLKCDLGEGDRLMIAPPEAGTVTGGGVAARLVVGGLPDGFAGGDR